MTKQLIGHLSNGPLDIVGDVHGELVSLEALLAHLGYGATGEHPQGRRLVFVGDLCDRGHDSPGVINLVQRLVNTGVAQVVLGNHELNLLRGEHKDGNGWFYNDAQHPDQLVGKFKSSRFASSEDRRSIFDFLLAQPVALERDDLRIVHACWHGDSMRLLKALSPMPLLTSFDHFESAIDLMATENGLHTEAKQLKALHRVAIHSPAQAVPYMEAIAQHDVLMQMGNPLKVMTSGVERECPSPFFSSGKWRFVERVRWWDEYQDTVPVIVGHYWRWGAPVDLSAVGKGGEDLFAGLEVNEWHGARRNVFCVDYSVGRRFLQREGGPDLDKACRLAALRWPERELVFDDGEAFPTY